ncbi:MAG: transcription termination/antitermination factor NusG [Treponema sp.]|jgi:transcriptional antiterminator NusG|nr:transcription termination/antitermination factor NusG [Treponema sp.]MBQ1592354.1 transcription termination/antitermination factor NusG [Treponema sp.]MBQ1642944.1 transcription termination/antitermination factor NusG [Treponema sp.]MBQ1670392.1 transcription termination/antitermination factor NusG [Treponema sp.]MBQ1714372.1 transcription termination/antitermination factor NusG [Treponema sp.]
MAKSWYIIHTFTGYEQKIERTLRDMLERGQLDSNVVCDVKVPSEEVVEIRNNKKYVKRNKILPSYIMLEMDLPQVGWKPVCNAIRHIQGVTGFVGTNPQEKPRPISSDEAKSLLQQSGEIKGEKTVRVKQNYEAGDHIKIKEGPFASFSGIVEEVLLDKNKLRVNVQIFGRETPVELDFLQVEKEVV